jgi:serine/threonine protein kinase/tetratricopeptide (TPR) repeat protein
MASHGTSIGAYRLLEPLGQGGMGVVWRARDERSGLAVALKTVRVPKAGLISGIRREVYALAQLEHPGIVRILDEGLHEGMPWYAMELLKGVTLRRWMRESAEPRPTAATLPGTGAAGAWWSESLERPGTAELAATESFELPPASARLPQDLHPALCLVRRLCHTLSYLHGEGIVHRDLKPENILIRAASGEQRAASEQPALGPGLAARGSPLAAFPVLVDFGLVSRSWAELSREALEVAGHAAGTVAYMAPEQGRGERVDARADLYSLGCILYELVTGRPPFVGEAPIEVLYQHLEAKPRPPSELAPGLPPELDELLLRLLEKQPRRRLGYADDVSAALGRIGIEAEPPRGAPAAQAYLYRPGFSGRADVLEQMRRHLAALRSGSGAMVLVGGESGAGKTRLLVELSRLAAEERLRVLTGECPPPAVETAAGDAPLQAFRSFLQAVADRCQEGGAEETERLLGVRAPVLAAYEPALAALPGLEAQGAPAELPPHEAQQRLCHYLLETLSASAAQGGELLLLLDDLQWADELSLAVLELMLRGTFLQEQPLLVVGVYRSEERGPALGRLLESRRVATLELRRLDGPAVGRIVADMLGLSTPPEVFARFLMAQSEGNPFFVAEVLRAAVGQELLYRDVAGRWQVAEPGEETASEQTYAALPLPKSLLELISGRLSGLSEEARRLVEALAVLGREADGALVADVSGLRSSKVMKATLEALSRQMLEAAEGERLRFVHDKLREVVYQGLEPARRSELHRSAAVALEELFAARQDEVLGALALHWEQGGEAGKAQAYHLAAARQQRDRYSWQEAETHYRAYLRLVPEPSAGRLEAWKELGEEVLSVRGDRHQAVEELKQALGQARTAGERGLEGRIAGALGTLWHRMGSVEEGQAQLEQALLLAGQVGDRQLEGKTLANLADLHETQGRMEQAHRLYEQSLSIARDVGDRRLEGSVLGSLADLQRQQGRTESARPLYEQSLAILRQVGHRRGEGRVLSCLAILHYEQGRLEEALSLFEQALSIARQVGDLPAEGVELGGVAVVQFERGRMEQAEQLFEQALRIVRQTGNRAQEGVLLANLAVQHQKVERLNEATRLYEQALTIHREVGHRRFEGFVLGKLAGLHDGQGRPEEAARLHEQTLAIHREVRNRSYEGLELARLADLRQRQGRVDEARSLYEQALAIALELGDGHSEGICELGRARLARRMGRLEEAEPCLGRAEIRFEELCQEHLALALCERGHLALAQERSSHEFLEKAREIADAGESGPTTEQGQALSRLQRAQHAFDVGEQERLFRGECVADLPEGLRRWLVEEGHLAPAEAQPEAT